MKGSDGEPNYAYFYPQVNMNKPAVAPSFRTFWAFVSFDLLGNKPFGFCFMPLGQTPCGSTTIVTYKVCSYILTIDIYRTSSSRDLKLFGNTGYRFIFVS